MRRLRRAVQRDRPGPRPAALRSMKKRGKDKDLPSCAQWPLNVRPRDYYLGAYKPHDQAETDAPGAAGDPNRDQTDPSGAGDPLAALLDQILADLDAGEVARAPRRSPQSAPACRSKLIETALRYYFPSESARPLFR